MKEKSIKSWLQELPDGYRELALANEDPKYHEYRDSVKSLDDALVYGFDWDETKEGWRFWDHLWTSIHNRLPVRPQDPTNEAEANLQIMDQRDRAIELLKKCCGRLVFYGDYETVPELDEFLATVKTINPNV